MTTIYCLFPDRSLWIIKDESYLTDNLLFKGIDGVEGELGW